MPAPCHCSWVALSTAVPPTPTPTPTSVNPNARPCPSQVFLELTFHAVRQEKYEEGITWVSRLCEMCPGVLEHTDVLLKRLEDRDKGGAGAAAGAGVGGKVGAPTGAAAAAGSEGSLRRSVSAAASLGGPGGSGSSGEGSGTGDAPVDRKFMAYLDEIYGWNSRQKGKGKGKGGCMCSHWVVGWVEGGRTQLADPVLRVCAHALCVAPGRTLVFAAPSQWAVLRVPCQVNPGRTQRRTSLQ